MARQQATAEKAQPVERSRSGNGARCRARSASHGHSTTKRCYCEDCTDLARISGLNQQPTSINSAPQFLHFPSPGAES